MRNFLWTGQELKSTSHKVSWEEVCKPKTEGGLRIRNLQDWNKAAATKHIWNLLAEGNSLWEKWVDKWLIKGRCFWEIKKPTDCSWVWKCLLSLRPLVHDYIITKIGDGTQTIMWFDYWLPIGRIVQKYGESVICD
ncbi:hypothetical protein CFOL_v3_10636 [Cephalotus follicularis]|uniref:Zf-RVT domain-containing protein n=1 Tax=Cephalotus follicularis TaxID=3775 RepID=A0A1Q3BGI2_CEPFO|nr:hypothetical protein CFOL_v3_10636 [Cephalotus follicularis]